MKVVFMGTPHFAVPSLNAMIENFDVKAVFTQPDKQRGRGKKVTFSPIKDVALENDIPVYQPRILRKDEDAMAALRAIEPDFIVVVAYGQILNKEVLDLPKYGCINLHASLLPKYRGAAPINWAVINGEKVSGNTTMFMDIGIDTGDMLLKEEVEMNDSMTASQLHDILSEGGGDLLVKTLNGIVSGEVKGEKQDDSLSCHAPKLDKDLAKIDWNKSALEIRNLIRGLNSYPGAFGVYEDKNMKIFESSVLTSEKKFQVGEIIEVSDKGITVQCGENALIIEKIQFPGKKAMKVGDYLRGNEIKKGLIIK